MFKLVRPAGVNSGRELKHPHPQPLSHELVPTQAGMGEGRVYTVIDFSIIIWDFVLGECLDKYP
jgi:hypothetical protein